MISLAIKDKAVATGRAFYYSPSGKDHQSFQVSAWVESTTSKIELSIICIVLFHIFKIFPLRSSQYIH